MCIFKIQIATDLFVEWSRRQSLYSQISWHVFFAQNSMKNQKHYNVYIRSARSVFWKIFSSKMPTQKNLQRNVQFVKIHLMKTCKKKTQIYSCKTGQSSSKNVPKIYQIRFVQFADSNYRKIQWQLHNALVVWIFCVKYVRIFTIWQL